MEGYITIKYDAIASVLVADVLIAKPEGSVHYSCNALWDTGATHSMISEAVVHALQLKVVGLSSIEGFHGVELRPFYEVAISLGKGLSFSPLIACGALSLAGHHALLGMDIISQLDFAVTNARGKTVHSIRFPSTETIDFGLSDQP